MEVFITRKIPSVAEKSLSENGFKVNVHQSDEPISSNELINGVRNCDAVISTLSDPVDENVISAMNNCRIIANYAVGFNNIDLASAKKKNIIVTNTPDILTDATADLTFALILACMRRLPEGEKLVRKGKFTGWKPLLLLGQDLIGKTIGIIGAGRIGSAVAKRAAVFGLKIIYFNKSVKPDFEKEHSAEYVNLISLLKLSDIVTIHCPLTTETFHLLNEDNLKYMKETAVLINTARGEIVDENVLVNLLKNKKIFAAGLDVYENEPDIKSEFFNLDNVILLPHLGSATNETREKMALLCAENIINVLNGKDSLTPVL